MPPKYNLIILFFYIWKGRKQYAKNCDFGSNWHFLWLFGGCDPRVCMLWIIRGHLQRSMQTQLGRKPKPKTVFTQYFRNCVRHNNWMSFSFESQIMRFCVLTHDLMMCISTFSPLGDFLFPFFFKKIMVHNCSSFYRVIHYTKTSKPATFYRVKEID